MVIRRVPDATESASISVQPPRQSGCRLRVGGRCWTRSGEGSGRRWVSKRHPAKTSRRTLRYALADPFAGVTVCAEASRSLHKVAVLRMRLGCMTPKAAPAGSITPSQSGFPLVGVTGFEPATSSSRTMRATKLRHTPNSPDWVRAEWQSSRTPPPQPFGPGVSVSSVTSGGQANRYGANGEVPTPADTCSHEVWSPAW